MASEPVRLLTSDEYLALERGASHKSEFCQGRMFSMAGAGEAHVLIVSNVVAALHGQLRRRPCSVYSTDMRVKVSPTGLFAYPDVAVVCGEPLFDDGRRDTLLNPVLIVEVLSESTRDYDRGRKFEHYRRIASFREYLLMAQDACHVEQSVRQPDGRWLLSETDNPQDVLTLVTTSCRLAVADVYEKVTLQPAP